MKIEQFRWSAERSWEPERPGHMSGTAQLVMLFGSTSIFKEQRQITEIKKTYPRAHVWGCSTAGEIFGTQVDDNSLVVTAVDLEHTGIQLAHTHVGKIIDSREAGRSLARSLDKEGLAHVLVLSDGLEVNGSDLVRGLADQLPARVKITGGLSGDGAHFEKTFVVCDEKVDTGMVAALGLYGSRLTVGYGSMGGWDPFGPERLITRSKGNVLYELDGKSALHLYKIYLGEHAVGLPATGLLFPLSVRGKGEHRGVVRTILAVDEHEPSMTFAGDVPEGAYGRLMKANFDRLIGGAIGAAKTCRDATDALAADLAILISCVGRKMVLKQRVEEEVEGVRDILGDQAILTGFYSYGEIAPFANDTECELHNQTMTITTLAER